MKDTKAFFSSQTDIPVPSSGQIELQVKFARPILYVAIEPNDRLIKYGRELAIGPNKFLKFKERFSLFVQELFEGDAWRDKWSQAYLFHLTNNESKPLAVQKDIVPNWWTVRGSIEKLPLSRTRPLKPGKVIETTSEFLDGFAFSGDEDDRPALRGVLVYVSASLSKVLDEYYMKKMDKAFEDNRMLGLFLQFGNKQEKGRVDFADMYLGRFHNLRFIEMDMGREFENGYFRMLFHSHRKN